MMQGYSNSVSTHVQAPVTHDSAAPFYGAPGYVVLPMAAYPPPGPHTCTTAETYYQAGPVLPEYWTQYICLQPSPLAQHQQTSTESSSPVSMGISPVYYPPRMHPTAHPVNTHAHSGHNPVPPLDFYTCAIQAHNAKADYVLDESTYTYRARVRSESEELEAYKAEYNEARLRETRTQPSIGIAPWRTLGAFNRLPDPEYEAACEMTKIWRKFTGKNATRKRMRSHPAIVVKREIPKPKKPARANARVKTKATAAKPTVTPSARLRARFKKYDHDASPQKRPCDRKKPENSGSGASGSGDTPSLIVAPASARRVTFAEPDIIVISSDSEDEQ